MGSKKEPGAFDCYANAKPDEPMFVLLGRDAGAGLLVRIWVKMRELRGEDPAKLANARQIASDLDAWAVTLGKAPIKTVYKEDEIGEALALQCTCSGIASAKPCDPACALFHPEQTSVLADVIAAARDATCDTHDIPACVALGGALRAYDLARGAVCTACDGAGTIDGPDDDPGEGTRCEGCRGSGLTKP